MDSITGNKLAQVIRFVFSAGTGFFWLTYLSFTFFITNSLLKKALFGIYMILAGVERFLLSDTGQYRNTTWLGSSFTQAELISIFMVLGGAVLCFTQLNKNVTATKHG